MELRDPIRSVIPGVQGMVLGILARTTTPLTGRAVAALLDGEAAVSGVHRALTQLVESGLVSRTPAGRAYLHELNREHLAAPSIESLADLRHQLVQRITTDIEAWDPPPVAAWLFGSTARAEGTSASDVDLLLVRPVPEDDERWTAQTLALAEHVRAWTGNACEIVEHSPVSLATLVTGGDPLIDSLRSDAIVLTGEHPRRLLQPEGSR